MSIPLAVTKGYEGQLVTSWWQPATQTDRDPNRDKTCCESTSNGTGQCQNGSSNLLTPYWEQPRSTRIVVAYPRPAYSAAKRTNYAPVNFDQQVQVSQGHTSYRNKEDWNTEVHGGGGLELAKPAREPASSRSKPCVSLKKPHECELYCCTWHRRLASTALGVPRFGQLRPNIFVKMTWFESQSNNFIPIT